MQTYLETLQIFDIQEIELIIRSAKSRKIKKGDYFVQAGNVCREVAFVQAGIFRNFISKSSGEEITYCISFPNNFISGYSSFITGFPTQENIQAITSAEVLIISKDFIQAHFEDSPNWLRFAKLVAESEYINLEKRIFSLLQNNASERYQELLAIQPDYVQKIPLQYLASYLGISQRHLSRLRKHLVF